MNAAKVMDAAAAAAAVVESVAPQIRQKMMFQQNVSMHRTMTMVFSNCWISPMKFSWKFYKIAIAWHCMRCQSKCRDWIELIVRSTPFKAISVCGHCLLNSFGLPRYFQDMQAFFEVGWGSTPVEIVRFCNEKDDGSSNKEAIVNATNRWYNGISSARLCVKVSDWEMEEQHNHTEHTAKIVFQLSESRSDGNSWRLHQFSTG